MGKKRVWQRGMANFKHYSIIVIFYLMLITIPTIPFYLWGIEKYINIPHRHSTLVVTMESRKKVWQGMAPLYRIRLFLDQGMAGMAMDLGDRPVLDQF